VTTTMHQWQDDAHVKNPCGKIKDLRV
jgi:hypothetical protein